MPRLLCSSLLIHLARTLVSLLTDSSQLSGRTSFSASGAANATRFFPDIGPALLKRWFIRHKAPNATWKLSTEFFKCVFWSSSTRQYIALMCPRGVWSDCADSRNDQKSKALDPDRIACFRPAGWILNQTLIRFQSWGTCTVSIKKKWVQKLKSLVAAGLDEAPNRSCRKESQVPFKFCLLVMFFMWESYSPWVCVYAWVCVRNCVSSVSDGNNFEISFLKCVKRMKQRDGAAVLTSKGPAACFIMHAFLNCLSSAWRINFPPPFKSK